MVRIDWGFLGHPDEPPFPGERSQKIMPLSFLTKGRVSFDWESGSKISNKGNIL
jgi:hypothetical protein